MKFVNQCYCPHSMLEIVFSPFRRDEFDANMKAIFGNDYLAFYRARTGFYHVLKYLRKRRASGRVFLPKGIGLSIIDAAKKANYQIVYYADGKSALSHLKTGKNDVVLTVEGDMPNGTRAFVIRDNAKNPKGRRDGYDFVLYSFGEGKPLSSGGGGAVVVNNPRFRSFLKLKLSSPTLYDEFKVYTGYITWRIKSYGWINKYGSMVKKAVVKEAPIGALMENPDLAMCSLSKKLSSKPIRMIFPNTV